MSDSIAADDLRLEIEAIERLEEEKRGLNDDIKDRFSGMKAKGYDVKTVRKVIRLRRMEKRHRDEATALLATYCAALGMQPAFNF